MSPQQKALVVGFGSIGRRHARLLSSSGFEVSLVTRQATAPFRTFTSIDSALSNAQYEYAIIATPTSQHLDGLCMLRSGGHVGRVLVEKPLCTERQLEIVDEKTCDRDLNTFVGYNLRFHPIARAAEEFIEQNRVLVARFDALLHLPSWRVNVDYSNSSSAADTLGGGVLRDLSHELDLIQKWFGPVNVGYSNSQRLSDLKIQTDDYFAGHFVSGSNVQIGVCLSYFCSRPIRKMTLIGDCDVFVADWLEGWFCSGGEITRTTGLDDSSYVAMHQAVLNGDSLRLCSVAEAKRVVEMIRNCRILSGLEVGRQ